MEENDTLFHNNQTNCNMGSNLLLAMCNNNTCLYTLDTNCSIPWGHATDLPHVLDPDPNLVEFQDMSRFWVQRVLVPIIMTIGVVGNTITIVIMTQRRMRSSTNCYLAALAIFDMSYLVFSFLLSFQHYPDINNLKYYAYWKMWPYVLTLTDASSNSSVWLTVTFTIERYIAVCYPMKGKVICTESRAQKMITIVFTTCFLVTLPTAFEWKVVEKTDTQLNTTIIKTEYSDLGIDPIYVSVYYWFISVLFIIVPFILLAVFNAFLIRSVHSSKMRRKTMTRRRETGESARQESKITIMLIAVVILFFVCQLPTAVILLYRSFHYVRFGSNEDYLLRGLGNIFNFLMAINAAGNFVLYCLLSQKYRRTFLQIFCPCLKGKISRLHSVYQNTVYSTVENESPSVIRRFSVRTTCSVSKVGNGELSVIMNRMGSKPESVACLHSPVTHQVRQPKLSFSSTVDVYSSDDKMKYMSEDSHNGRLLRGFRCPWRRQKVSSGSTDDEPSDQFIALRATKNCVGLPPTNSTSLDEPCSKSQL